LKTGMLFVSKSAALATWLAVEYTDAGCRRVDLVSGRKKNTENRRRRSEKRERRGTNEPFC